MVIVEHRAAAFASCPSCHWFAEVDYEQGAGKAPDVLLRRLLSRIEDHQSSLRSRNVAHHFSLRLAFETVVDNYQLSWAGIERNQQAAHLWVFWQAEYTPDELFVEEEDGHQHYSWYRYR